MTTDNTVNTFSSLAHFKEKIAGDTPVLVDFWATWCGPCRVISPIFKTFSEKDTFKDVEFYKVDVDAQPDIAQEVKVRAMPTFILFQKGEKVDELVGAAPKKLETLAGIAQARAVPAVVNVEQPDKSSSADVPADEEPERAA